MSKKCLGRCKPHVLDYLDNISWIVEENQTLNYTDSNHQTYILSPENSSAGLRLTLNATAEGFDHFYLTLSHIDGGEGGYYEDIPSSEKNVKVTLQVYAGEGDDDQSSGVNPFTVAWVPTGMNTGVGTTP